MAVIGGGPGGLAAAKAILTARWAAFGAAAVAVGGAVQPALPALPPVPVHVVVCYMRLQLPPPYLTVNNQSVSYCVRRPSLRVAVFERSSLRPKGASVMVQPNGVKALAAIDPGLAQVGACMMQQAVQRWRGPALPLLIPLVHDAPVRAGSQPHSPCCDNSC